MKLPGGCGDKSGEIVKLNKAVYGLKQAGRQWSLRLTQVLVEKVRMEQCKPCIFRLRIDGETTMILCVHVDDIIVAGESRCAMRFMFLYCKNFKPRKENFHGI